MSEKDALWRTFSEEWSDSSCGTLSRTNSEEKDTCSEITRAEVEPAWEPPPLTQQEAEFARKAAATVVEQNAAARRKKRNEDLRSSVLKGDKSEVSRLLSAGAEPNREDQFGNTALLLVAYPRERMMTEHKCQIAMLLLEAGACPRHRTASGKSALEISEQYGEIEIMKLLCSWWTPEYHPTFSLPFRHKTSAALVCFGSKYATFWLPPGINEALLTALAQVYYNTVEKKLEERKLKRMVVSTSREVDRFDFTFRRTRSLSVDLSSGTDSSDVSPISPSGSNSTCRVSHAI